MSDNVWDSGAGSDVVTQARNAATLGVLAMTLHMTACCSSVFGVLGGTALGGMAWFMARQLHPELLDGEARAYSNVARYTGLISLVWGSFLSLAMVAYFGFIFLAVLADM